MRPNNRYHPNHSSIYPGEYEPLAGQEKELSDELKKSNDVTKPPVNVVELHDYYRIEVAAPGLRRESFFITTNGRILSITGMPTKPSKRNEEYSGLNDLHAKCIKRDIVLPLDVDTEFAAAEYANGILCICMLRTSYPGRNRPGHIIVY
jgi:HSP20 family protein